MLYLAHLELFNVRCFEHASLSFYTDETPAAHHTPWTLLLGNNGTGKSTILRSIALSACSETSASGLLRELAGSMIRFDTAFALIKATFVDGDSGAQHVVKTKIYPSPHGEEELDRSSDDVSDPGRIFMCGYGANRRSIGASPPDKYSQLEAVYSLFNYESAQLLEPETLLLRLIRKGRDEDQLLAGIDQVLMLPEGSTRLSDSGLTISGPWGDRIALGALGDGYVATLAVIVDMLGWHLILWPDAPHEQTLQGIILIDEIEQHLHPLWQKRIVVLLQRAYPQVQFIATTHSPLVAIGAADCPPGICKLALAEEGEISTNIQSSIDPPKGRRADQVLTSFLFGLQTTSDASIKTAIQRVVFLRQKGDLTASEAQEFKDLQQQLDSVLGEETNDDELIRQVLDRTIEELLQEQLTSADDASLRLKVRLQLKTILERRH